MQAYLSALDKDFQYTIDGGTPEDITRLTWYVTDKKEYLAAQKDVGRAYREVMGKHFPAMAMVVVAGLVEDDAKLEIEADAVINREELLQLTTQLQSEGRVEVSGSGAIRSTSAICI